MKLPPLTDAQRTELKRIMVESATDIAMARVRPDANALSAEDSSALLVLMDLIGEMLVSEVADA
tara:strand:+ start:3839 stop:4030 length:192 start_codon:yes stop_codon:yes gene_type:complete